MSAYYNEFDPNAAQWLRNLISMGHIAPGEVDERSIEDVTPNDLVGFTQCHFFAGIGIWSSAFRAAGWPDSKPVWTGSCPCQPFSQAGKGDGVDDERHLWPAFLHLIKHGKGDSVPVFGEQVASKDGLAWLDIVQSDMEGEGYTFWPVDICAAGIGAPHIRQRLFFIAHRGVGYTYVQGPQGSEPRDADPQRQAAQRAGHAGGMGNADSDRARGESGAVRGAEAGEGGRRCDNDAHTPSNDGGLADTRHESGSTELQHEPGEGPRRGAPEVDGAGLGQRGGTLGMADTGHDERGGRNTVRGADGEHDGTPSPGEGGGAERIGALDDVAVRSTGDGVADADSRECGRIADGEGRQPNREASGRVEGDSEPSTSGVVLRMAEPNIERRDTATIGGIHDTEHHLEPRGDVDRQRPGPTNGFWRAADWIFCKDGKWRCVEPGTQPLVDGFAPELGRGKSTVGGMARSNRTLRLKGYGNGINREVAVAFIKTVMESTL